MPVEDPNAYSADAARFSDYLRSTGQDWLLVSQDDDQRARVRFTGLFQGGAVVWDCCFMTLDSTAACRNFIEIEEAGAQGVPLTVGLALACIDRSAIEKMVIMIRNYKRLRPGRHEYGEIVR